MIGGRRSAEPGISIKNKNEEMLYEADNIIDQHDQWAEDGTQFFSKALVRHAPDEPAPYQKHWNQKLCQVKLDQP